MTTLADLTYFTANELGALRSGTANNGGTTTIVDTLYRDEDDDYFNKGTAWILATTDGAAPVGEMRAIANFSSAGSIITVNSAFSAPVEDGDNYALGKDRYKLPLLIDKVNSALRRLGSVPRVDTSITTAGEQTEYDLPVASNFDLRAVYIQGNEDSNDNKWVPIPNFEIGWSTAGGTWKLLLPFQPTTGRTLKLEYTAVHTQMSDEADILWDSVHPDLVVYEAALNCLQWYSDKIRSQEFENKVEQLRDFRDEAIIRNPIPMPAPRMRKIAMPWGDNPLRGIGGIEIRRNG